MLSVTINDKTRTTDIHFTDLFFQWLRTPSELHEERAEYNANVWAGTVHDTGETKERPKGLRGRGHTKDCTCSGCTVERLQHEGGADITDSVLRKIRKAHALAMWVNPAKGREQLRAFHRAHVHYCQLAESAFILDENYGTSIWLDMALREECEILAGAYRQAGQILWARMEHFKQHGHKRAMVKLTQRGTIGRTAITEDDLYCCAECDRIAREESNA